jgi:phospholipid/cholesterol/gamma-HCH transport system substrate-binding protein
VIRNRSELAVGATLIAALLLFLYSTLRVGGCSMISPSGRHMTARFDDASGVERRTDVLIAGVRVGEVEQVELEAGRARITLRIENESTRIPLDSTVAVRSRGLLGERVVEITPGSAARLAEEGDTLTHTQDPPDLDQLLDSVALISEDLQEVSRSLRLVLGGPAGEENLAGIVQDVRAIAGEMRNMLEENDERFARVMMNLDSFSSDLARLADENGQTVEDLLTTFADTSKRMGDAVDSLARVSERVDQGEGTLGRLVSDDALYVEAHASLEELRGALREVRRAAEEAQEQLPVTVLGSVVGTLF